MSSQKIIYIESPQKPLAEVPYDEVKSRLINPLTNKPYKGIVLEGVFADLNDTPNNNQRIYDIPEYLKFLQELKEKIHSPRGVYGETEHPQRYSIDYNYVSHKLLDVWYDENQKLVYGRLLVLNTPNGKKVQEIIKSGGQVAVSARAAGDEIDQPDGTKRAVVKLLTTYDIVYHPGFSNAIMNFKELNESQQFIQNSGKNKQGFSLVLYAEEIKKLNESYLDYINLEGLNESEITQRRSKCFLESLSESLHEFRGYDLFENEESQDERKLENNENPTQREKEKQLSDAVNTELEDESNRLNESKREVENLNRKYFKRIENFQQLQSYNVKKRTKQGNNYFDGSGGFLQPGQNTISND